ncbi:hypothetical protein F4860DRAFT_509251 [Xylaria cubensis]|nr:hypothetical protein F4860DRAFT_509251 [Xylaria cubensis]
MHQLKRKLSDGSESSERMNKKRGDSKRDDELDAATEIEGELTTAVTNSLDKSRALLVASINKRKELEERLKLAQQQVKQLIEDLEQISGEQHSAPDLDNDLETQFMDLRELVRSLTKNLCDRQILLSSIPAGLPDYVTTALMAISGLPASRLLKSRLHARYFIQALIWRLLCDDILTNPFVIWGGGYEGGEFISRVCRLARLPIKRLQRWRIMTGKILVDGVKLRPERLRNWRKKLIDYIGPLVKDEHKDDIAKHVDPILDQAIRLAKNLAQSRTMCFIQRKADGADDTISQKYDDIWMEAVEKSVGHYEDIDFLITPALVQLTNSVGAAFEHPRVIVKAELGEDVEGVQDFGSDGYKGEPK